MPCWYYDKKALKRTPSILDGISYETELRYRREGAAFIREACTKLDLGYNTYATGAVYFHRFYMFHSFKDFPRYVTACCCLLLAGKVEETPKKCRDIIWIARSILTPQKFLTFGDNPKEEVMTLERILLQTIKFDLQVEHPHRYVAKYGSLLIIDRTKLNDIVQATWTIVNDSLYTTLSLQWEPEVIAVAFIYFTLKVRNIKITDWVGKSSKHSKWWDIHLEGVTTEILDDIGHQVIDMYETSRAEPPESPPPSPRHSPEAKKMKTSLKMNGVPKNVKQTNISTAREESSTTPINKGKPHTPVMIPNLNGPPPLISNNAKVHVPPAVNPPPLSAPQPSESANLAIPPPLVPMLSGRPPQLPSSHSIPPPPLPPSATSAPPPLSVPPPPIPQISAPPPPPLHLLGLPPAMPRSGPSLSTPPLPHLTRPPPHLSDQNYMKQYDTMSHVCFPSQLPPPPFMRLPPPNISNIPMGMYPPHSFQSMLPPPSMSTSAYSHPPPDYK